MLKTSLEDIKGGDACRHVGGCRKIYNIVGTVIITKGRCAEITSQNEHRHVMYVPPAKKYIFWSGEVLSSSSGKQSHYDKFLQIAMTI
jgi:hypothetical protein